MDFPDFPNMPHPPFDYQRDAFFSHQSGYEAGEPSQLIVMATGLGKSVTALFIARDVIENRGGRVLILAHLENLIGQLSEEFSYWGLPNCVEKAERKALGMALLGSPSAKCVVACVATLKGRRLEAWPRDYFDLIITDEAHRATADSYRAIYSHFESAKLLGLTATPNRTDARNLGEIFGKLAYQYLLPAAIAKGDLAKVVIHEIQTGIDIRSIKVIGRGVAKDYDPDAVGDLIGPHVVDLAKAVVLGSPERPGSRLGPGQTLIFAPCRMSAQAFASAFSSLGVSCASVDYKTADRHEIIDRFKEGQWPDKHGHYEALANLGLLGVGFNHKPIGNIVNFRPTQSALLLEQMMGRGTRLCQGKSEFRFIDFAFVCDPDKIAKPVDLFLPPGADPSIRDRARKAVAGADGAEPQASVARAQEDLDAERQAAEEVRAKRDADRARREARQAVREKQVSVHVRDHEPIKHRSRSFDLFTVRNLSGLRLPEARKDTILVPASPDQAAKLRDLGLESCQGMSQREAAEEIRHWDERRECGMASMKQCRILIRHGYPPDAVREMSNADAQRVIGPLMAKYKSG